MSEAKPREAKPGGERSESRTMTVWCPDWPVIAALGAVEASTATARAVATGAPAAVFDKGQVLACSLSARAEGVRRGMRRRDAQSRCPDLEIFDHNPDTDARAFEIVLDVIEALSPGVAPLRPGLCALRVPSRYYGGEAEAAAVIAERLVGVGVWDCRIGIADGLFAAEQAARRALAQGSLIVAPGGSADFLRELPVDVLGDPELVGLLRRMGLHTVGDFAALEGRDVHTRFGAHGALLHRFARGQDPQPVSGRKPPPDFERSLMFEPPLELVEPIAFSMRTTAEQFVVDLADQGLVCTTVRIEVESEGALASTRSWLHPRWFGPTDLIDRVRWQLSAEGAVGAPVDCIRLIPEVVEPLGDHADSLFGGGHDERVDRGLARVQSMVGHEAVVAVAVQGGRGPADRQLMVPWGERAIVARPSGLPWPGSLPPPAPATVFATPQEALVVGAGGYPVGVSGRGMVTSEPMRFRAALGEALQPVASWAGPWPIDELWWDEAAGRRIARFQVVGVDGSAWLMIVENGRWWTEACYD